MPEPAAAQGTVPHGRHTSLAGRAALAADTTTGRQLYAQRATRVGERLRARADGGRDAVATTFRGRPLSMSD